MQRPCGGRYADGVQLEGYRGAREQSWQGGHWAGQGGTMDAGGGDWTYHRGFNSCLLSHTDGKKGKECLPVAPCKKWVVLPF